MLTVASLLSLLFLTLHITDDIVRGISKAESSNIALLVLALFLYGTLVLNERRSGHVIIRLIGLIAAAMPVMHMRGAHYGEIAKSPGRLFLCLDTLGARWAGRLHRDSLGARAVGSATEAPPLSTTQPFLRRGVQ
jgi:hypothetical protein